MITVFNNGFLLAVALEWFAGASFLYSSLVSPLDPPADTAVLLQPMLLILPLYWNTLQLFWDVSGCV